MRAQNRSAASGNYLRSDSALSNQTGTQRGRRNCLLKE